MENIIQKKRQHIDLLQKYTNWGKGEEEAQIFRNFMENEGINWGHEEENSQTRVLQTKILVDTDKIVSPIHLDSNVELPIVELFIN